MIKAQNVLVEFAMNKGEGLFPNEGLCWFLTHQTDFENKYRLIPVFDKI